MASNDPSALIRNTSNTLTVVYGDFVTSPLWYILFAARFVVLLLIAIAFAIWDLIITIFTAMFEITTNLIYIIPFVGIFVGLYFMHIHWAAFVHFLKYHLIPIFGVIYNDFLVLIVNDIFLPIASILIYIWDALVQVIGFFIYFVLNIAITIFTLIIQLIGELNLPHLFEQLMEVITPIIQLAISILQLVIQVGSKIIVILIPILVFCMKVFILYIKIMAKIWIFLIVTLFKILAPILKAVIAVVKFVLRIFHLGGAARFAMRSLLSLDKLGPKKDAVAEDGSHILAWNLYTAAMNDYSISQYDAMFDSLEEIHRGVRGRDVFNSQDGYPIEPGSGMMPSGGEAFLYDEADLYDHEQRSAKPSGPQVPASPSSRFSPSAKRSLLSAADGQAMDATRNDFLESIRLLNVGIEGEEQSRQWQELFGQEGYEEAQTESPAANPIDDDGMIPLAPGVPKTGRAHRANMTRAEYYDSILGTEDDWMIDLTWNMTREQVFPRLKGRTVRRARLHTLIKDKTPAEMHKVRVTAVAWRHAIEHGWYRAHKRHISSGQLHRAISNGWRHLSGHDTVESWAHAKFGKNQYASVAHFVHSMAPDWTQHPLTKAMIRDADPDQCLEPNGVCKFHHAWVREDLGYEDGMLPREYYEALEAQERYIEEEDYLSTGNGEPSSPLPYGDTEQTLYGGEFVSKGVPKSRPTWKRVMRKLLEVPGMRKLLDIFGLNLAILYERDCFHNPKNILCIPQIPSTWKLPKWNVSAFFLVSNLNDNPQCTQYGLKATACVLCWDGFVNAIWEIRFLIYWLDLISIILIIGLFLPRPSEALGMLAKTFPPLAPFINWYLIFPAGEFPPGDAWACWFENLYYLFELIIGLLIFYFILWPLISWGYRFFVNLYALWLAWSAGWIAHRSDVEYYDEVRLARIDASIRAGMGRSVMLGVAGKPGVSISAPMHAREGDIEQGRTRDATPEIDMRMNYHRDPAAHQLVFELEKKICEELDDIESIQTRLCDRLGVSGRAPGALASAKKADGARKPRVIMLPRAWERVTALLQIPAEMTPAYLAAQMQRRQVAEAEIMPGLNLLFGTESNNGGKR